MYANSNPMPGGPEVEVARPDVTVEQLLADEPNEVAKMLAEWVELVGIAYTELGGVRGRIVRQARRAESARGEIERRFAEVTEHRGFLAQLAAATPGAPAMPTKLAPIHWPGITGEEFDEVAPLAPLAIDARARMSAADREGWTQMRLVDFSHEENVQAVHAMIREEARIRAEATLLSTEVIPTTERVLAEVQAHGETVDRYAEELNCYAEAIFEKRAANTDAGIPNGPADDRLGPVDPNAVLRIRAMIPKAPYPNRGEERRDLRLPIEAFPYTKPAGKSRVPLNHSANYLVLLQRSGFEVSYDVIRKEATATIHGRALPRSDHEGEVLLRRATDLCEVNGLSTNGLQSTLIALMAGNEINPVVDYLSNLVWDGKPRFDSLAGAVGPSDLVAARAALRIFLNQACAAADGGERGMRANPAALPKYETVLVLQGEQGVGKTSGLRRLLPAPLRPCFQDGVTLALGDKDSERQAVSAWITELGELEATFRRSEIERLKSFLSRYEDKMRVAYGRVDSHFQRRTVFVATANGEKVLTDVTGNRRFAVLSVTTMDIGWSDAEIDQVWAEAWHRYRGGEQWWPTEDEKIALRGAAERFETASAVEERLVAKYDWERGMTGVRTVERLSVVQILDLLRPATGGRDYAQVEMSNARETIRRLWRRHGAKLKNGVLCVRVRDKWTPIYASGGKQTGFLLPPEREEGPTGAADCFDRPDRAGW